MHIAEAQLRAWQWAAVRRVDGLSFHSRVAWHVQHAWSLATAALIYDWQAALLHPPIHHPPLAQVLEELGLSQDEFIDVCILCGCDYTPKISGIGAPSKGMRWLSSGGC